MKPLTIIGVALLVVVVAVGVVMRVISGDDSPSAVGSRSTIQGTPTPALAPPTPTLGIPTLTLGIPTPTLAPPTRTPTPPRPTPLPGERPTIRLSDEQYESITLNNAIAQFVIEHGFGYPTENVVTTSEEMQVLIAKGEIDLEMEGWQHNRLDWYDDAIRNQEIENLGQTYESGPQHFIMSTTSGPSMI